LSSLAVARMAINPRHIVPPLALNALQDSNALRARRWSVLIGSASQPLIRAYSCDARAPTAREREIPENLRAQCHPTADAQLHADLHAWARLRSLAAGKAPAFVRHGFPFFGQVHTMGMHWLFVYAHMPIRALDPKRTSRNDVSKGHKVLN
jgi:hypothetical protein